jgi:hypothetical protein
MLAINWKFKCLVRRTSLVRANGEIWGWIGKLCILAHTPSIIVYIYIYIRKWPTSMSSIFAQINFKCAAYEFIGRRIVLPSNIIEIVSLDAVSSLCVFIPVFWTDFYLLHLVIRVGVEW